jgi:site-specific recombinase XerD
MAKKSLDRYVTEFLEYLEIERNRSQKTVKNYHFYLSRFCDWLGKEKQPADITAEDVRKYRLWLNRLIDVHGEELKKNTQNYHLIALRSFLKYLAKRDIVSLAAEKIELMKMPDREVAFLHGSDLNRLLEAPLAIIQKGEKKPSQQTRIALRDKAILELFFSTGLRVSELILLKKDDISFERDEFTVQGKGKKSRVVFVSEQARFWLKKYISARKDMNQYLFVSHDKRTAKTMNESDAPLTPRSAQRIVQKWAKVAGITKIVTPHTLRHSYATDLLQNGADIRSVQSMLGHSSITTTQIYTHVTDKELHNIHKKFHGKKRNPN